MKLFALLPLLFFFSCTRNYYKVTIKTDKYSTYYDLQERACHLASIINSEAGICSDVDKYLVGSSVLNRWDGISPLREVIAAPHQYNGYKDHNYYPKEENVKIALNLLRGVGRNYEVLYFYNSSATDTSFTRRIEQTRFLIRQTECHKYF